MTRRGFLRTGAAAAAGVGALAAFGAAPALADTVTIKFQSWESAIEAQLERKVINAFMARNPNIKIDFSTAPWTPYWTKMQTAAASGQMPDTFWMSVALAADFGKQGSVQDLGGFVKNLDAKNYFTNVLPPLTWPPNSVHLWAFPFRWVISTLFYNRDMFDAAKIPYPDNTWTYEKVREVAKELTLKDSSGNVTQWGYNINLGNDCLDSLIKSWGGRVLNASQTKANLLSPETIEAVQWTIDLVNKDKVSPSPVVLQGQPDPFLSGKVAMYIGGSYNMPNYVSVTKFKWNIAMSPKGPASRNIYGGPDSISIAKTTQHLNESYEFLRFMTGPQRTVEYYGPGEVPIYKPTAYSKGWLNLVPGVNHKVLLASEPYMEGADFGSHNWIQWRTVALANELQLALLKKKTVKQALTDASTAINQVLSSS
jgi:multiple sugar transport system substrate-binding protein